MLPRGLLDYARKLRKLVPPEVIKDAGHNPHAWYCWQYLYWLRDFNKTGYYQYLSKFPQG